MPKATYTLELMLNTSVWADVTADWHTGEPLVIERGIEPGERMAGVGRMSLALYDPDGRYTPGHPAALPGFDAGVRVRLRASDGTATHALFTGRVESITPYRAVGARGRSPQHVRLRCVDDMAVLWRVPVGAFPLLLDVAPGVLVERLITRSVVPVGREAYWRLGHPQAGRLDGLTVLSDPATGVDLDAGQSVFPWAGDTWAAERPVAAALRDVCASEGGWFAIAADGTPTFRDRHARPRRTTPNVVLSAGLVELHARRGEQAVANSVEVTVHPRMVGEPGEVLWRAGHAVRLAPGEVRTLVCRYQDPTEHVMEVGALSVELPRRGVDFTATDRVDGTGEDLTHTVMVALESGARGAALTLWSDGADERAVYVHGLQLRGTPLRRYTPVTVRVEDDASIVTRGRHPLRVDLPLQDDARTGEDVARALLANRREPHPWPVIGLEATARADLLAAALGTDVGTRIHLDAPELGLGGAACFVEHIRHHIERGGASHRVTWRTTPADLHTYWVLGAGLGIDTRLGY